MIVGIMMMIIVSNIVVVLVTVINAGELVRDFMSIAIG